MLFDEIFKEKIKNFKFINGDIFDIISFVVIFLVIFLIYYITTFFKDKKILVIILLIIITLIIINNNLKKNENFTNIISKPEDIYSQLNTGDFILFRSYANNSISFILIMKIILSFLQNNYFTHIGMIYKHKNGKIYILESTHSKLFCNYKNKTVNSESVMVDFYDRINNSKDYRIHIVKTNIHQYINLDKLINSIQKYKNYSTHDINCIDYIVKLLYDNDIIKLPTSIINHYLFDDILNKFNYNINIQFQKPIIINNY